MEDTVAAGKLHALTDSSLFKGASIVALLLAFIAFPFSFPPVQDALFGKRTEMTFERLSEIPLVDINRPLAGLRVEFQGRDLTALKQGVVAAQVQLRNTGDVSITPSRLTSVDPLGFEVEGGTVVRETLVAASSDHLKRFSKPVLAGNRITVSHEVIFDPGDFVRFDLLLTKPLDGKVRFRPVGKVEGMPAFAVREPLATREEPPYLTRVFGGDGWVQALRVVAYPVALIVLIVLLIGAFSQFDDLRAGRKQRRRNAIAEKALETFTAPSGELITLLAPLYKQGGIWLINRLQTRLGSRITKADMRLESVKEVYPAELIPATRIYHGMRYRRTEVLVFNELRNLGLLNMNTGRVQPDVIATIDAFKAALESAARALGYSIAKVEPPSLPEDIVLYSFADEQGEPAH